jgi:CheY-like chemotaxis protein
MARASPQMLIVAADPTLRFTLEELLGYYGYTVTTAASEAVAQVLIAERTFDLLLLIRSLAEPAELNQSETSEMAPPSEHTDWLDWIPV